jgi:hypothetical protein
MEPVFLAASKVTEIAAELSKTRTAPIYTKFSASHLTSRLLCDIFGSLVYALRYVGLVDDQNLLYYIATTDVYAATALQYAFVTPTQFDTLEPVALMHAAEVVDLLLHQPIDISSEEKVNLWHKRVGHVLSLDAELASKAAAFVEKTLKNDQLFEDAFADFDKFEHSEIPSLSSDKHRGSIPARSFFQPRSFPALSDAPNRLL